MADQVRESSVAVDWTVPGAAALRAVPDDTLAALAGTDAEAFAEIYRRYEQLIRRYCWLRLRDRAAVEDATSDIFVKAIEGLRRSPVTQLRPWLFTIAHHHITDQYRRARQEIDLDAAAEHPSDEPSPEFAAISRIEIEALYAAIALLKPDQARVLELRLSGLDGPQIRQVLNRSRSWVDTTQYRALIRLRDLLARPERETN